MFRDKSVGRTRAPFGGGDFFSRVGGPGVPRGTFSRLFFFWAKPTPPGALGGGFFPTFQDP